MHLINLINLTVRVVREIRCEPRRGYEEHDALGCGVFPSVFAVPLYGVVWNP